MTLRKNEKPRPGRASVLHALSNKPKGLTAYKIHEAILQNYIMEDGYLRVILSQMVSYKILERFAKKKCENCGCKSTIYKIKEKS